MPHPDVRLATDPDGRPRLIQYFSLCGVWAVTPYDACDLRCSYCITFSQGRSTPRLTTGVAATLQRELAALPRDATLAVGGLVDAYPSVEDELGVTRKVLQALVDSGRRVIVITKGPCVVRDTDLLLKGAMRVCMSLSTLDDEALQSIEPHVALPSERMAAVETLCAAGVDVTLQAQPWIPGVTDAESIISWANGRFPVSFTPLNVDSPGVARTQLGRQLNQHDINRAYLTERARLAGRAKVIWHKPLWVGTARRDKPSHPGRRATDTERRNLAAVGRYLDAFGEQAQFEALIGFISPYARLQDTTGHAGDRAFPQSGRAYDLLYALYDVFDSPAMQITLLQASGDAVDLHLEVRGVHARPLFDIPAGGHEACVPLAFRYVFDSRGLVLDYTQWADLDALYAGSHGASPDMRGQQVSREQPQPASGHRNTL
ncbi:MAG: hypothetical protein CME59_02545 [Halioglobus sp.]|nr:hypothetical protein [Halioglobus sp.]|tara:strand:- start:6075 stop:7367 length:1293 start_codon:yes stop_codon:yes gene_type:complete